MILSLQSVIGEFSFTLQVLWKAPGYRCHISAASRAELKCGYKLTAAVILGGCVKYIQDPDVIWNQPFKQSLHDSYNQWMTGDIDKEYTAGGTVT